MRKIPVGELVIDYTIFPRDSVDNQHIQYMAESYRAGHKFDPIVICKKTKRISDGVHRRKMYQRVEGDAFKVDCVEKTYANDMAFFKDAMRLNSTHGRALTQHDRTHCILVAEKLGIPDDEIASALSMTVESVGKLKVDRVGELKVPGKTGDAVALKRTIRHKKGQTLTKGQAEANKKLSGMDQKFYVHQLILLIENDLLDTKDAHLFEALSKLHGLLSGLKLAVPA